jgi:hypothetical protein
MIEYGKWNVVYMMWFFWKSFNGIDREETM